MSDSTPPGIWLPVVLVGAAGAIAAEVAIAMLLYSGPGFIRSLTTLLAVEGFSLAAGLHAAPAMGVHLTDGLRRRWLFCLGAFLVAALYGTFWSFSESLGAGPIGQGLGLALLAGLPLFACGALLGGLGATPEIPKPGAAAALGVGLGFIATGALLPHAPIPASLLVGCLMLLSGGGMIYGSVVADQPAAASDAESEVGPEDGEATAAERIPPSLPAQ